MRSTEVPLCPLLFLSLRVVVLVVLWGVLLLMAYKVFTMEREYTEYDPYSILDLDSVRHLSDRNPLATFSLSLSLFLPTFTSVPSLLLCLCCPSSLQGASMGEIRKQYRKLSKVYHPDKEGGDQEKFMQIAKAYEALVSDVL